MLGLCAILAGTGMQACKKDDKKTTPSGTTPTPVTGNDNFEVTVNGTHYDPSTINVQYVGGVIAADAIVDGNTNFAIYTNDELMPGTYAIDGNTQFDIIHSDDNNATYYASTSGSVTVLTHDTVNDRMTGTFNCTLTRTTPAATKTGTNGAFTINY